MRAKFPINKIKITIYKFVVFLWVLFPVNFIVYCLVLAIFGTVQWHSPLEHQRTTF